MHYVPPSALQALRLLYAQTAEDATKWNAQFDAYFVWSLHCLRLYSHAMWKSRNRLGKTAAFEIHREALRIAF